MGYIYNHQLSAQGRLTETNKQSYETVWSVPIGSLSNLEQALLADCSLEELADDNKFFCSNCQISVLGLLSTQLSHVSPVILIHLKRFISDRSSKVIRKLTQFISHPELLDLSPFINPSVFKYM